MRIKTAINVAKATPGRHWAGPGLYLLVSPHGQRRWVFRYTSPRTRKVTEHGLGSADLVTLAEARTKAHGHRQAVLNGQDPIQQKREARRAHLSFADVANAFMAAKQPGWSQSHSAATRLLLTHHSRALGTKHIGAITTDDVEAAVRYLWQRSPEQGRRTVAAISAVYDYAMAIGRCSNNPAMWRVMRHRFPKRTNGRQHYTAMDYAQVPEFVRNLRAEQERNVALSPYVIEFLLLTACRPSEVAGMQWAEVDFANKLWTIPAERTKARREHRVPLCNRAIQLLAQRREYSTEASVWSLTLKALYRYLTKNMGQPVTVHGFRSSFRDWAGNETNFRRVTCEIALGHRAGDATEIAYKRKDELEKRRVLMQAWAEYCGNILAKRQIIC
jgi:integrase